MAGTTSTGQGAREVFGSIAARIETPLGDSAMDDTNDAIRVNIVAGAGSGGTSATDDAAFTVGSGTGTPIMGLADETAPDSVNEGDVGVVRMTLPRALHVNLRDASGNEITSLGSTNESIKIDDAAFAPATDSVTVIGAFADETAPDSVDEGDAGALRMTLTRALHVNLRDASGSEVSVGGGTQYDEDTASTAGDKLTMAGVVRQDTAASLVGADGDRTQMQVDASGRLHVNASGVAVPVTDNGGNLSIDDGGNSITVDNTVLSVVGGGTEASAQRVTIASDSTGVLSVDDNGASLTVDNAALSVVGNGAAATALRVTLANDSTGVAAVSQATASSLNAQVVGAVAHDAADAGNPIKVGHKAIAHGTNPTAVAASDRTDWYANRAGVPFVLGGHPNIITREVLITDANGAQTDASIAGAIGAGSKIVLTMIDVMADGDNTVNVAVRVGFGTATLPAASSSGVNGIVLSHPDLAPGSGVVKGSGSGIIAIGADNEELRLTCDDPVSGNITVTFSYFTIES